MKGWRHYWDKIIRGKRESARESSYFMFVSVFSVAVSRLFLSISHFSHFFPKDHPKVCWRVLFWANACWCGGSKNKSRKQRQLFPFSVSMLWRSTEHWGGRELVQISTPGSNFGSLKHCEASGVISSECCPRLPYAFS